MSATAACARFKPDVYCTITCRTACATHLNYPNPEIEKECIMKFRSQRKQHHISFLLICDFESFLQENATFGKTMEQVRHRVNIRLIADPHKLTKAVSKVSFRHSKIINYDLIMMRAARQQRN